MSDFDSNPFADPNQAANPFADPSVRQVTQPVQPHLDDYNPFAEQAQQTRQVPAPQPTQPAAPPPQPAVMQATEQPPAYTPSPAQPVTDDLQRRQEELERKAAELQRKEQEMRNLQYGTRQNNFPPLPEKCCVQPCFYQDFAVDIPIEFQKIVKTCYYLWLFYAGLLLINMIGALAYLIASMQGGVSNSSGITFGVSILYVVLFTPCSFVCWYRPIYKAFRSDSSFNFFVFFFVFFMQFCVNVISCLGIDGWGTCGFFVGISLMTSGGKNLTAAQAAGLKTAGSIALFVGVLFGLKALFGFLALIKVHRIYRSTGASFEKAQAEFATGVMSNKNVQQAAGQAVASGARAATENAMSGNRY